MNNFNIVKNNEFFKILMCLAFSLIITSCGNKNRSRIGNQSFSQIDDVVFQEVLDKVITNNCLECHKSYSNYKIVKGQASQMLDAIVTGRMPKGKPALNNELRSIFASWVNDGAPESVGVVSEDIKLEATFESILINVFAPKCLACHSGEVNAPGPASINLSTYEDIIASNNLYSERFGAGFLDTEFPDDSEIIFLLEEGAAEPMPPLTLPGSPDYVRPESVTAEELEVIIDWINKGLPQN